MADQATANYSWFRQALPGLLADHRGKHALLHDQQVTDYFASSLAAVTAGMIRFGEDNFSVEVVDDAVEDLGFYSHVGSALHA